MLSLRHGGITARAHFTDFIIGFSEMGNLDPKSDFVDHSENQVVLATEQVTSIYAFSPLIQLVHILIAIA
jgi:hypothetical protein